MICKLILITSLFANLAFGEVIEITLDGQGVWKGEVGDVVEVELISSRGKTKIVKGSITKHDFDYIIIDQQLIFITDLRSISTLESNNKNNVSDNYSDKTVKNEKANKINDKTKTSNHINVKDKKAENQRGYVVINLNKDFQNWDLNIQHKDPGIVELGTMPNPIYTTFKDDYICANSIKIVLDRFYKEKEVTDIVFLINSPGGSTKETNKIRELIAPTSIKNHKESELDTRYEDRYIFHCVINGEAASAGIAFACMSDNIFVLPGSFGGGATAYSISNKTGSYVVDAKFNALWAAENAATAERKGHNPLIIKAMILMEEELYVWKDKDRNIQISNKKNDDNVNYILTDSSESVLSLTASQMQEIGFAKVINSYDDIGSHLNINNWSHDLKRTKQADHMRQKEHERLKRVFAREKAFSDEITGELYLVITRFFQISNYMSIAKDSHPSRFNDYEIIEWLVGDTWYRDYSLNAKNLWNKRLNNSISLWSEIYNFIKDLGIKINNLQDRWDVFITRTDIVSPYQKELRSNNQFVLDWVYQKLKNHEGTVSTYIFNIESQIRQLRTEYKH